METQLNHGKIAGMPLPGAHLPFLPLDRPGAGIGGKVEGWVLSDAIIGIATHFYSRRTFPCVRHFTRCEGCTDLRRKAEWNGYFAVVRKVDRAKAVFVTTQFAIDSCLRFHREDFKLRGSYCILRRKGEESNGAHQIAFTDEPYDRQLPPAPDVLASLARMWKMSHEDLVKVVGMAEGGAA